jgi:hypothetical protein
MGLKPDAPKAPDPTKTANTQLAYNQTAGQNTVNMNSLNNNGVFGSGTVTRDAKGNVTGQTQSLDPTLTGGANSTAGAFASTAGNLPGTAINWDNTTAPKIAQQNYDAYSAMTAPQRAQQQNQQNVTLGDRGIPVGSEVWNNASTNLNNSFDLADQNAAAQAWNAVPGMQGQLIQNQSAMQSQPYQQAAQGLGLLQGLNGLAPNAQLGQSSVQAPNYMGAVQNNYDAQNQQYQNQMSGIGSLAGAGLGLLTAPLTGGATGGLSNSLIGQGVSHLFN